MAFYHWSTTAGSNGNSDPTINFLEGQPPSSLNDSDRAMMARLKEWGNDISGAITTGGTSTAYTVTSGQVFDTLAHLHNQIIAFVPNATNTNTAGNSATLAVDGLTAKPIRFSPGVEIPSGTLVLGTPYLCTYNNTDGAFYLHNLAGHPYGIPVGGFLPYCGSTAPNSAFILPFGQNLSRTTFATFFSLVSTTFGAGDGSTTFGAPDLRGRSVFGLDNMGGSAASRITVAGGNFDGTALGGTGGAQNHTLSSAEMPSHTHTATVTDPGHTHTGKASNGTSSILFPPITGSDAGTSYSSNSAQTGISVANASTGGGGAHTVLNPCMVLPYILRVI